MIELTKEEVVSMIKALSRFEGFLYSLPKPQTLGIAIELDAPVELLSKKLTESK